MKEASDAKATEEHSAFVRDQEHIRQAKSKRQSKQHLEARWKLYLQAWEDLGKSQWNMNAVPWPTVQGESLDITRTTIEAFLSFAGDVRKIAREELRRRWHPDRFQQKSLKHVLSEDKISVMSIVTRIAQILNEIITV